ncbi:MAG: cupredoxin domain-containing protein, partial [Thermoleophilia bacterium]|nr:cupredoxin domain-containing protein [Thermoleophilia bacterium]
MLVLAFVAAIFLSGAATSENGRAASSLASLTVQSTGRNACSPTSLTAAPGAVTITFSNANDERQQFGIVGHGTAGQDGVRRGESATLSADLPAGSYTFWCGDDRDKAMRGTLTIGQGGSSGGGTGGTTTGPAGPGTPAPPSNVSVTMQDNSFSPSTIHAAAGQVTVTITNSGHSAHTFTIGSLVNQVVAPGQTKTVTFTAAAGTYRFFCVYHGSMVGSLILEAAAGTPAGSPTTPPATTTSGT